ncbi:MAG: hypothetical protein ACKOQ7_09065, partial [Actinomycetota bacterium]
RDRGDRTHRLLVSGATRVMMLDGHPATDADREQVVRLIGRQPMGEFQVVVRDAGGEPVVLRNAPLLAVGIGGRVSVEHHHARRSGN